MDKPAIEAILQKFADIEVPSEFADELSTMPNDQFNELTIKVQEILEQGNVSPKGIPYVVGVIREQVHRIELLNTETERLEKIVQIKKAECKKLEKEAETLEKESTYLKDFLQEKENNISYTPRRNDPCPCGSGKKYKHCCGK